MGALAPGSCLTLSHGTGGITIQLRPKASMRSIHQRVPGGRQRTRLRHFG